jgi:hypothetical protein
MRVGRCRPLWADQRRAMAEESEGEQCVCTAEAGTARFIRRGGRGNRAGAKPEWAAATTRSQLG